MSNKLVLASQSPRRKELLMQLGYQFQCVPADVDESVKLNESAEHYVNRLAKDKAIKVAEQQDKNTVVLGSDTSVVFQQHILGKPTSLDDCIRMLSMLSGEKHQVITSVAVVQNKCVEVVTVITDVEFKSLTEEEIIRYWHTGEPKDKAGAYGIQGIGGQFVKQIQGSYSAVVGLPLYETAKLLSAFAVDAALATH